MKQTKMVPTPHILTMILWGTFIMLYPAILLFVMVYYYHYETLRKKSRVIKRYLKH